MRRTRMMADVRNLLIPLQGCMKQQPVTGRAGGLACGNHRKPVLLGRESEIRSMLAEGATLTSMAAKLGVARKTLREYMQLNGIKKPGIAR